MSETSEVLRRAAGLMRELAEAALPANERWEAYRLPDIGPDQWTMTGIGVPGDDQGHRAEAMFAEDAVHIASWHPAVALAVADWLDLVARAVDAAGGMKAATLATQANAYAALDVARKYLGADQ